MCKCLFLSAKDYQCSLCLLHSYLPKLLCGTRQDVTLLWRDLIWSPPASISSDCSYVTKFCYPPLYLYTIWLLVPLKLDAMHAYQLLIAINSTSLSYSLTSISGKVYRVYPFLAFYKIWKSTDVIYTLYCVIILGWDINGDILVRAIITEYIIKPARGKG